MDRNNTHDFAEDSSLESDETVVTELPEQPEKPEQPEQPDPSAVAQQENLHFVGYEPPKPKAWKVFILRHKVKLSLAVIFVVVSVVTGAIFMASTKAKEAKIVEQSKAGNDSKVIAAEVTEVTEDATKSPIGGSAYSLTKSETMYKMVSDGEIWLERSESEWINYEVWNGWLFFLSNKTPSGTDASVGVTKIGIDAFNFKTKQYVEVGDVTPPSQASLKEPITEQEGYLYMPIYSGASGGVMYRCKLDVEKACSAPELFYDGAGSVHTIDEQNAFLLEQNFGETTSLRKLKRLTLSTKQAAQIYTSSSEGGAVEQFGAFSSDGYAWLARTVKDVNSVGGTMIERLFAVDIQGDQKFVLTPESFPIVDAKIVDVPGRKAHEIMFANSDQEVVFDVNKKEFGPIAKRNVSEEQQAASSKIERIITLPSLYGIKQVL